MPPRFAPIFVAEFGWRTTTCFAADRLGLQDQGPGSQPEGAGQPAGGDCKRTRLIAIGQDEPSVFCAGASLGVAEQVSILQGRSDIPRFLLGADLLIHPAYNENTGTVLLEALVAGLPVLATAVCGYAHYIEEAEGGLVVPEPFAQSRWMHCSRRCLRTMRARRNGRPTRWPLPRRRTSTAMPNAPPT
jgi:glycosyltransferase involved in cell wall biosynthesis